MLGNDLVSVSAEVEAIRADAERRLRELRALREVLVPDRDDAYVLSELVTIDSQIRAAERALRLSEKTS
jgi:hypothetical protein